MDQDDLTKEDTTDETGGPPQTAPNRRHDLLAATFDIIATVGFEGLRTRAVADKAGVNVATLHYYFPTKENLIWALAEYLGAQFMTQHADPVEQTGHPSLDRLRQEFADCYYYLTDHASLTRVMGELALRAYRDETVAKLLEMIVGHWRLHLTQLMGQCIDEGICRPDLDKDQAATTLICIFSGITSVGADSVATVQSAFEQWAIRPEILLEAQNAKA